MRRRTNQTAQIPFFHFKVFTFGSEEEFVGTFGSLERAAAEWDAVRDEFLDRWDLWGMPSAWWMFEHGVPDEFRRGSHAIITQADADTWEHMELARRRYLVSIGIDPARPRRHARFVEG